jgi:hypothetical protein
MGARESALAVKVSLSSAMRIKLGVSIMADTSKTDSNKFKATIRHNDRVIKIKTFSTERLAVRWALGLAGLGFARKKKNFA